MSTKTPWESRVGMLLKQTDDFAWAFKPVDSKFYGGQTRLDWLACDQAGRFWMVEVKHIATDRKSINLRTDVSAGQRDALTSVSQTTVGIALLVVGRGDTLYLFDWSRVLWQWRERNRTQLDNPRATQGLPSLLPLDTAPIQIKWTGKKGWATIRLLAHVEAFWAYGPGSVIEPTLIVPERPSRKAGSSRSTSKPGASIPTPAPMLRLVR